MKDRPPTRRGILSIVSSIYDPIQWDDWDDRISPEDLAHWQDWLQQLPKLEQFTAA